MLISCPECHFKRHVDEKQIPESATLATCPKCQNKFRFRDLETGEFIPEICLEREQETETSAQHAEVTDNSVKEDIEKNIQNTVEQTRNAGISTKSDTTIDKDSANVIPNTENNQDDPVPLADNILSPQNNQDDPLNEPKAQPYEQNRKKQQYVMMTDDVPWEHAERYGRFGGFIQTISRVMFRGKDFFSTIHSQVSSLRPASFYALIGLIQAIVAYFLSPNVMELVKTAEMDPQKQALMENLIAGQSLPMVVITTPFIMILQLLIYTAFIYLAIRITNPEKADFPLTLRIIAYASAPMILSVVPYIGGVIGLMWFIYNIFIGVKYALRISWQRTFLALAPIFVLWLFIALNQAMVIINTLQG